MHGAVLVGDHGRGDGLVLVRGGDDVEVCFDEEFLGRGGGAAGEGERGGGVGEGGVGGEEVLVGGWGAACAGGDLEGCVVGGGAEVGEGEGGGGGGVEEGEEEEEWWSDEHEDYGLRIKVEDIR